MLILRVILLAAFALGRSTNKTKRLNDGGYINCCCYVLITAISMGFLYCISYLFNGGLAMVKEVGREFRGGGTNGCHESPNSSW